MGERAKRLRELLTKIPTLYGAIAVLILTLAAGWTANGWFRDQIRLPRQVSANADGIAALEKRVNTRMNDISATVDRLVASQTRLTARMETLICLLDAERQNLSVFGCPR